MPRPFSLAFLTVFDVPALEAIRVAAAAGYDMIGLRLLPAAPGEPDYPLMTDAAYAKEAVGLLADLGLRAADIEVARLRPDTEVARFEPFLERAAFLGGRHVLVAGDDPDRARLTETFGAFCRLARGYGLTADLEFMPWTKVPDVKAARAIVDGAGEPNGGVLVDALHFDRSGSTLEEVAALPRERIDYVQFCDGPADYDRSDDGLVRLARAARLMPGEGAVDLVGLARALPEDVTVSIEVPNHELARTLGADERARRALEVTKRVLAAAGRLGAER